MYTGRKKDGRLADGVSPRTEQFRILNYLIEEQLVSEATGRERRLLMAQQSLANFLQYLSEDTDDLDDVYIPIDSNMSNDYRDIGDGGISR